MPKQGPTIARLRVRHPSAAQNTNETITGNLEAAIVLQDELRTELGDANTQVHGLSEENRFDNVQAGRYSNLEQEHNQ